MSTQTTPDPRPVPPPPATVSRRLLPSLRDARIRSKLGLLLVVPVLAIVSLAAVRLVDSGQRAMDATTARSLASLAADVSALTHEVQNERMAAAQFLVDTRNGPGSYNQQARTTDEKTATYATHRQQIKKAPAGVVDRLQRLDDQLATLNAIRQEVLGQRDSSVSEIVVRYGGIINDLCSYREEVGQIAGDTNLADGIRAAAAFSKAKAQKSEEQAIAFAALGAGQLDLEQFSSFLATLTAQQESFVAFALAANAEQRAIVGSTITGDAIQLASRMATEVSRSAGQPSRVTATEVSAAVGAVVDLMRWAEQRLDAGLVADAEALRDAVVRQVVIESSVVLVTLALAIMLALIVARSMARSLSSLREGALAVATRELPDAVARLRDSQELGEHSPEQIVGELHDPIKLSSRDEIGQVAQAFNVVHREAVRVAAEQAALRTSVAAMFLNLARRSQALVDRMIGELDDIERGEEDPKRLARLFNLDHLATRMRRNDENLLVLAGADSSPPRRENALLIDVVRAAQSEVERYDRIEFATVDQDVSVAAHAVNDVVRLLAELFDNATRFSPPETSVVVDGRRIGDYVLVQVEDRGLGMTDEQMTTLNERLAVAPTVDVAAFRMMGLAVVGRLAARYGIKIEMSRNPEGGTIAYVNLPTNILILPQLRVREHAAAGHNQRLALEWTPAARPPGWPMQVPALTRTAASTAPAGRPDSAGKDIAGTVTVQKKPTGPAEPVFSDDTAELPIFRETEALWFRSHGHSATDGWDVSDLQPAPVTPTPEPPVVTAPVAPVSPATLVARVRRDPDPAPATGVAPVAARVTPVNADPATPVNRDPAPVAPVPPESVPPAPAHASPKQRPPFSVPRVAAADDPPVRAGRQSPPPEAASNGRWQTAADDGWRAAAAAGNPETAGTTKHGLPKRLPAAQLVPGGIETTAALARTRRTPDDVRGVLSAYHRGVQRGRVGGEQPSGTSPPATNHETNQETNA